MFSSVDCLTGSDGRLYFMMRKHAPNTRAKLHTRIVSWHDGDWSLVADVKGPTFEAGAMAILPDQTLMLLSEEGQMRAISDGVVTQEPDMPGGQEAYMIQQRCIDGKIHAVGTERHIWRRDGPGDWTPIHAATHTKDMADLTGLDMGFLTISGSSAGDMYVSGYRADTWRFDGQLWHRITLPVAGARHTKDRRDPTDVTILASMTAPDGTVYFGGKLGVLCKGQGTNWGVVDLNGMARSDGPVGAMAWFQDRLYIAGGANDENPVCRLDSDDAVHPLANDKGPMTATLLCANDEFLFATSLWGTVKAFDGQTWITL